MRILFIASRFPYPLLQGDRLICYHRLKTLSQSNEITLVTFYQSRKELDYLNKIAPFCKNIYPVYLPRWASAFNCLRYSALSQLPLQVAYYRSTKFQQQLDRVVASEQFDVAHYFLLRMADYKVSPDLPKIVEIIDSMQLNLESRIPLESLPKQLIFKEELKRIRVYENQLEQRFKKIILVGKKDADYLLADRSKIAIIPNGIATDIFKPSDNRPQESSSIKLIFAGRMGYAPNIHAVQWFVNNCWESLVRELPDIQLTIAGADPPAEIVKLGQISGIHVTGYVESMVDMLNAANIVITPMQSGSGMQNKILEAMSCALPVITTSIGLGSIEAIVGKEILVADTPTEFIDTLVRLARDRQQIVEIGNSARDFVEKHHSWTTGAIEIESIYDRLIGASESS
jgi:polysaccharide biosynthesis protein PslH